MRKFPSQLPGLSELNRGTPQQQASPSAIAQTTKFPLPPASANHDAQTLPIKKALPNGASVQSRAMQAEQQGPDDAEIRTSPDLIYIIPNGSAVDAGLKSQRDNSKRFIQAWHDSGYTYDQLVAEGLDPTFLSGLYRELKLPFPSVDKRPAPSDQGPQSILLPQQQALPPKPPFNTQPILRPLDTQQASPAPAAAPVKITKPVDHARNQSPAGAAENNGPSAPGRQDYIARLMAAKTKKANVASPASRGQTPVGNTRTVPATQAAPIASAGSRATAATAMSTEPAEVPRAAPTATEPRLPPEAARASRSGPLERGLSASEQAMAEAKKKAQTALAKERMAALARNKASKTVPAPSSQAPLSKADDVPATNGVALSKPRASPKIPLQNQPPIARPTQPNPATPVLPVQQRATPVSRIPGLSTLSPSLMEPGSAPSLSQKPSARDPHLMSPPPQTTSTTLFKGERELLTDSRRDQSSQPSAVAPVIIELSDDDDAAPITRAQTSRSPPSSKPAVSMPTAPATNGVHAVSKSSSASKEETQSSRQLQILGMRKKIAELELKRKQKAQENQPDSRPTAAAPISDAQPALSRKNDEIPAARTNASKNDAPPPTKRLKISSDVPIEQPSRDLEPAGARESLKLHAPSQLPSTSQGPLEAASIPRNEQNLAQEKPEDAPSAAKATVEEKQPFVAPPAKALNPKSRRRTELQNKLPAIEASFANNTSRLETLRAQMRELEESLKREREDKDRLIAELESLGVDTEGMDHTELQETKDEIMAQAPYSVDVMDLGE